jgi:hypothetical protein
MVGEVAGIIRLSPRVELEVAPKFLGVTSETWREDFFLIANLSRSGRVLSRERISASSGARQDLASLVARSMANMYWEQHRRPLRTYRRNEIREFSFEGDPDFESLYLPDDEGFRQEQVQFDRRNKFNSVISSAARTLASEVRDPDARRQIQRVNRALAPQEPTSGSIRPVRLPGRHRHWQELHDLSCDVLTGLGTRFLPGRYRAPGFILETWRAWEDLVLAALRVGMKELSVTHQPSRLGVRIIPTAAGTRIETVNVTPDVTLRDAKQVRLLIDAKYKSRVGPKKTRVVESDLYESLAFLEATGIRRIVLAYPRPFDPVEVPLGAATEVERLQVSGREVIAMEIQVSGISRSGGFRRFALAFADTVSSFVEPAPTA